MHHVQMSSTPNGLAKNFKVKHKTLSAYYPIVHRLEDCFQARLSSLSDNAEYTRFISTTLCATKVQGVLPISDDGHIWQNIPVSQKRSHQECIDWIMGDIARRGAPNLLLKRGRGSIKQEEGIHKRTGPSAILGGPEWRCLRERVGDTAFRNLIVSTSIFTLVENNSFVQITGVPIHDLYVGTTAVQSTLQKRKRATADTKRRVKKRKTGAAQSIGRSFRTVDTEPSPADRVIARQRMFYGQPARTRLGKLIPGLHPQHMLNIICQDASLSDEDKVKRLQDTIFSSKSHGLSGPTEKEHLAPTLRDLLNRQAALPYGALLRYAVERAYDHTQDGLQPLSHSQVSRYIGNVIDRLLTLEVVGSQHNMQMIKRHARLLITAKQFEPITLHMLMADLRTADFSWLSRASGRSNPAEYQKRRQLVEQFIFWLFNDYLISLLRNTFYVTETAQTRYQTVYYPHEAWAKATKPAFEQLRKDHLEPVSMSARNATLNGTLGVSAVRLIPKPNGFRPIVNLGKKQGGGISGSAIRPAKRGSAANEALRGVHQVLTYEKERNREALGSALFGTNEIFAPLHGLQTELKMLHGNLPRLYFVKMDIKSAFDTIKQEKMLQVVEDLLDADFDYILMMFCMILPPASKASQGSARRLFKTRAVVDDGFQSTFTELAREVARPLRNAILVDLLRQTRMTREECRRILRQHVTRNIWQVGNQLFRQKEGIPQGSKISSMLCSIFYAAMERHHLSCLSKPGSRLLRYIDDFLYITDDYESARRFIHTMSTGFPEYGAFVSSGKTLTSFEHARGSLVVPVCAHQQDGGSLFPFCGFTIDTKTLELSPDIPRMIAGGGFPHMGQSFALRFARRRGKAFVGWLSRQLENRNHIAYLNTSHNTVLVVHLNVFLNFASTAMKIPHYFDKAEDISSHIARTIFESICASVEYTYVAGRARVRHAARNEPDGSQHYLVRKSDFEYLAKSAIIKVLVRKAGRFKDVLHLLTGDLDKRAYRYLRDRHQATIDRGWGQVKGAKY